MKYILTLLFLHSIGFSQTNSNLIYWSENIKLEWKDFKGKPENHPTHQAMTRHAQLIDIYITKDSVIVESRAVLDRNISWVKGKQPQTVLEHEQIHFDLAELLCRTAKKVILEKGAFNRKTAAKDVTAILEEQRSLSMKDQALFDQQSYTSLDKQNEWKSKVAREIRSLEAFKGLVVKVKLTD